MKRNWGRVISIIALFILALGCRYTTPTPVAWRGTETAAVQTGTASVPTPTVFSSPTPLAAPTALPTRTRVPIVSDGPWLVFSSGDGKSYYAADRDSDEVRQLELPNSVITADLPGAVSPDRSVLLARAGDPKVEGDFALYSVAAVNLETLKLNGLISSSVQKNLANVNNLQAPFAVQAAVAPAGIAWNPNGSGALFPMAVDGDSTNLFRYNPISHKVDRISSRYQQGFAPQWSPGGQALVFQEADTRDNPYRWRASLVGSIAFENLERVNYLYSPPNDSLEEVYAGWINDSRLLIYTRAETGNHQLRLLNVLGGTPTVLFEGYFDSVSLNHVDGSVALLIKEEAARINKQSPGVYLRRSDSTKFDQFVLGDYEWLGYDRGLGKFVTNSQIDTTVFDANGIKLSLVGASRLSASPDGQWLISWSEAGVNLHTADGKFLQQITNNTVESLFWQTDSKGFYLLMSDGLWHSQFPRLEPVKLTEDVWHENGGLFNWLGSD